MDNSVGGHVFCLLHKKECASGPSCAPFGLRLVSLRRPLHTQLYWPNRAYSIHRVDWRGQYPPCVQPPPPRSSDPTPPLTPGLLTGLLARLLEHVPLISVLKSLLSSPCAGWRLLQFKPWAAGLTGRTGAVVPRVPGRSKWCWCWCPPAAAPVLLKRSRRVLPAARLHMCRVLCPVRFTSCRLPKVLGRRRISVAAGRWAPLSGLARLTESPPSTAPPNRLVETIVRPLSHQTQRPKPPIS